MEEKTEKSPENKESPKECQYLEELMRDEDVANSYNQHNKQENDKLSASIEMKLRKQAALVKLRYMVEDAIKGNYLIDKPEKHLSKEELEKLKEEDKDISIWGVPLLPSKGHGATNNVLLKFLTAKEFKVHDAFEMLRDNLKWRKEYKADTILAEDLHPDLKKVVYINGVDNEGHPLYYNAYGAFKDKDLYRKILGTEDDREKFLRWIIQFMEKGIQQLSFRYGSADSIVQITDFKNSSCAELKELRNVNKKAFMMLDAHYPEIVHKHILINVPFWYYTSNLVSSKILTQRTKKKFIFARPSKVSQTLLQYISPENLPVEYGGLKRDDDDQFLPNDTASEIIVKSNASGCIRIPATQTGVTIVWDFTVVGWEASFKEEFVPEDEGSYIVMLRKEKENKDGDSVRNSFYISEPGMILITIENPAHKKKSVFYRFKTKPTLPSYASFKR